MLRIVDGMVLEGKPDPYRWVVTVHELSGHIECSVQRPIIWEQSAYLDSSSIKAQALRGERDDPEDEEKAEANRKRSARRASTRIRRLVKSMGHDSMLTLTYKANQTDLGLCKSHLKEFVRRIRRVIPGFSYVASFEQQERGAWHVHMTCHRIPPAFQTGAVRVKSFDLIRSVWRSVVGHLGGNIDLSRRKACSRKTPAKLAAYLSKYLTKAFTMGRDHRETYSSSAHTLPVSTRLEFRGLALADLLDGILSMVGLGREMCSTWVSRFGDCVWLVAEPPSKHSIHCRGSHAQD